MEASTLRLANGARSGQARVKILVVDLDNLGDAIMGTAVLRPLKKVFPMARVGYWVKAYAKGVFEGEKSLDFLHACDPFWDSSPGRGPGRWKDFSRTLKEIKAEKYNAAILLNTEWRRALAVWWIGIPIRVGFDRRKSRMFLTKKIPVPTEGHIVDDNLRLIEAWTEEKFEKDLASPFLEGTEKENAWFREWRDKIGWKNNPLIVFHPFAGNINRSWPLEKWSELARGLATSYRDLRIIWICGPGEEKGLKEIQSALPSNSSQIISGAPLEQVKAIIKGATLFAGVDSGPSHIAEAMGIPIVSLFGPTQPERCGPYNVKDLVVLRENPISNISVEDVREAVQKKLR